MSFQNVGPVTTLVPGASAFWEYSWNRLEDRGLQIAGPHPQSVSPASLGHLVAKDQGMIIEGINQTIYTVTITNVDNHFPASHNLRGGGLT